MYSQHTQQLAYAPTPYSYTPSNLSVTINPDEEVKLATTAAERNLYESLAELYSIIVTLEALEKAYLKDSVLETEYTETCNRLLKQYKSNLSDDTVSRAFGDIDSFKHEWDIDAPRATERLKIGLPATVEAPTARSSNQNSGGGGGNAAATHIVAASENFITLLDAIQMNMLSKDTLHPILVEAIQAVNRVTDHDFENKGKIVQWLITLNQMRAAEELTLDQARELKMDMELAYNGFKSVLGKGAKHLRSATLITASQPFSRTHGPCPNIFDPAEIGDTTLPSIGNCRRLFCCMERQLTKEDLGLSELGGEEPLHVLDLPQIHTKPSAKALLDTLALLSIESRSWEATPPRTPGRGTPRTASGASTPARAPRRKVEAAGVPQYLTKIVSSHLGWIEDDTEKEKIWDTASVRLSERSGRAAMPAFTRTFPVPRLVTLHNESSNGSIAAESEELGGTAMDCMDISIHEPALTADKLGFKTWAASYVLARKWSDIAREVPSIQLCRNDDQSPEGSQLMLELGAGTGLVGISAAAVLGVRILLTDLPAITDNLARNVRDNRKAISDAASDVSVAVLDWSEPENVLLLQKDSSHDERGLSPHAAAKRASSLGAIVIVAADPIYGMEHPLILSAAITCHLSKSQQARVVIAMPLREAYAKERALFTDQLKRTGFELCFEMKDIGLDDWGDDEEPVEVECSITVWRWHRMEQASGL